MKRTYPIKKGDYWNLLKKFIVEFGYPSYYEELVIYFDSPDNFKITLTREGLRWSWSDIAVKGDKHTKSKHRVRTSSRDLKDKFLLLIAKYSNAGSISVAPFLRFIDKKDKIQVEIRPKSLIGEIVSISTSGDSATDQQILDNFFKQIEPYVEGDLFEKISGLKRDNEEIVHLDISESPILNTKILDFCRENGITNPFRKKSTYRELLSSKSNDYGVYEELFYALTSVRLLTTKNHYALLEKPEKTVSFIIPCYNSEATINKVLRSIKYQRIPKAYFENTEVIIIDDNSNTEISKAIKIHEYPFRIEIIRLNRNCGVSHARQLGVTHSMNEILIFIDSDIILSGYYLADHIIRNTIINNAVFISFKENVSETDSRISDDSIMSGAELPNYSNDLRIIKKVEKDAMGSYQVSKTSEIHILEDTNFLKDFYGSRIFGAYDLSCMVTGHNFTIKKELVLESSPFSRMFKGWGMEDVYFGLKMISNGNFIIPVLSSSVFHINHPPRSGSNEKKRQEYEDNIKIINSLLDSIVD